MALKPTIYKLRISLSDLNRNYYDTLNLTIAQHPSETLERMMARAMAFCLNADPELCFTKGLSEVEQPDIWHKSLEQDTLLWIDVGEPTAERLKKAAHSAKQVKIYSFNAKSATWWQQLPNKAKQLPISFWQFDWQEISRLASFVTRTMDMSVTITEESAYVTTDNNEIELHWQALS